MDELYACRRDVQCALCSEWDRGASENFSGVSFIIINVLGMTFIITQITSFVRQLPVSYTGTVTIARAYVCKSVQFSKSGRYNCILEKKRRLGKKRKRKKKREFNWIPDF